MVAETWIAAHGGAAVDLEGGSKQRFRSCTWPKRKLGDADQGALETLAVIPSHGSGRQEKGRNEASQDPPKGIAGFARARAEQRRAAQSRARDLESKQAKPPLFLWRGSEPIGAAADLPNLQLPSLHGTATTYFPLAWPIGQIVIFSVLGAKTSEEPTFTHCPAGRNAMSRPGSP